MRAGVSDLPRRKRSWLSVKIALTVAVTVLTLDQLSERIQLALYEPSMPCFLQAWAEEEDMEGALQGLLEGHFVPGRPEFADAAASLDEQYSGMGSSLFLFGSEEGLVYRGPALVNLLADGEELCGGYRLFVDGEEVGCASVHTVPLWHEGRLWGVGGCIRVYFGIVGKLMRGLTDFGEEGELPLPADSLLVESGRRIADEVESLSHGVEASKRYTRVIVVASVALVVGFCVAFLVTRRIRRLARQAADHSEGEIPGPFTRAGRDEIGYLADVLGSMREHTVRLVEGLRETDRRRRAWVTQLSHDLRTPLAALRIAIDRAGDALTRGEHEQAIGSLEAAAYDTRRLNEMVENVLELGRLDLQKELRLEPVLPWELVHQVVVLIRPIAKERGVELSSRDTGIGREIQADGSRLLRALENLLINAIHWSESRVDVVLVQTEHALRIEIHDDGPGFPLDGEPGPVDLEHHLQVASNGECLGLVVAQRIAARHSGRVLLQNLEPRGARVTLELPTDQA